METLFILNKGVLLISLAVNLGLGIFIFLRDRKNKINRAFGITLFLISFWIACFIFLSLSNSYQLIVFWLRSSLAALALFAGHFLYFSLLFPKRENEISWQRKSFILLPGYIFALTSIATSYLIKSFTIHSFEFPFIGTAEYGSFYLVFILYLFAYFMGSLTHLAFKFFRYTGHGRLQIFYVLLGMGVSVTVGVALSLLFPLFGRPEFFAMGPPFTLLMAGSVTYAIVRHRLLNIENFLNRGLIFFALATAGSLTITFIFLNYYRALLPTYVLLANFTIGTFVLFHNFKGKINRSFFIVTLLMAVWTLAIFMSVESDFAQLALFWIKVASVATCFAPAMLVYFCLVFPKEKFRLNPRRFTLLFLPAIVFTVLTQLGFIVQEARVIGGRFEIIYGPAFPALVIYILAFLVYGFSILVKKYSSALGPSKIQIRYIFLGFLLASIPPAVTNLLLPLFGHPEFRWLAPSFMIFSFIVISYAIVKHRLMSIEVIIQRSSVYAMTTVLILVLYALAVIISETFLRQIMGYTSLLITAGAALLIAIAYQPIVGGFQTLTDRLFFRGRYDYQKTLRKISQKIASVIKLEELSTLIVSSFIDTMKVSEISFLLLEKDKAHFRSVALTLPRYVKIEIGANNPLVSWISLVKDILVKEEIEVEIYRQASLGKVGEVRRQCLDEVHGEMERLRMPVWIPIISKEELIGIIALGQKLSGDIFTTEDLGLLSTLASQVAVALDNARLYDEVVNMKDYSEKILQSMINGMLTVNTKGKIVTCNSMCERITGRREGEILGKTCEDVWGKRGIVTNIIENTLNQGKCYVNFEARLASPERGFVPVSFSSTVLLDHQGKKMGVLLSIQDLSEVKELEGKVRQADKLGALATMAAGMAHEIKNPLSSMKVLSQLLPKKINDAGYRKKLAEIMPREINRIDRIVESLLGFARATALKFEITDIKEILEDNLKYFEGQAKEEDINITRIYEQLPLVEVDKEQISQVFSNLILNAMQAMPDGGELKVEAFSGKTVEGIIREVKIKVTDTGYGISEDMVKKLFDPFFTTKYGGTGLGLTITHSIVDAHKGYVDVESKVGKGTSFTVTLPVSQGLV